MKKEIDWEQRRFELIRSAIQGTYAKPNIDDTFERIAESAIEMADTVIRKMREGEEPEVKQEEKGIREVKIGETIEVNGKRYICKESIDETCDGCALRDMADCVWGKCSEVYREDKKNVIFVPAE